MSWTTIDLIFRRELVDQLRDRRTLFTVFVMPLLLYPLLGSLTMQMSQFFRPQPVTVVVAGAGNLPAGPALFENAQVAPGLDDPGAPTLRLLFRELEELPASELASQGDGSGRRPALQAMLRETGGDLLVVVPHPIRLDGPELLDDVPDFLLVLDSSVDSSRNAASRWRSIAAAWRQRLLGRLLAADPDHPAPVPALAEAVDLARPSAARAQMWSRLLPLLIMIWCLTGAFYPAIDLCAGEKERGTLETLLSSPASRSEIALGKLGAVMVFSIASALLNLASLGLTAWLFLSGQAPTPVAMLLDGPPPAAAVAWVFLATIPASALFGALSLAAAAFARSSKEGQYYLIPLIMCGLPLMIIPTLPGVRLDLGTSLIPVTGIMLVLRAMIEGRWGDIVHWFCPVTIVTVAGCAVAIRWVVYQFSREEIIFRPSDRFSVRAWLREFFRSRDVGPAPGHAVLCGLLILLLKFMTARFAAPPASWQSFALQTSILLGATILMPAVLMTLVLSRRPAETLLLRSFHPGHLLAAAALAVCLHPLLALFSQLVMALYPDNLAASQMATSLAAVVSQTPSFWILLLVLGVAPAVCEEVAFRGFVLSGFRSLARPAVAILLSAAVFAGAHAIFQQSVIALVTGLLLGLIAWRSQSLAACIVFHATHNMIALTMACWDRVEPFLSHHAILDLIPALVVRDDGGDCHVAAMPATIMSVIGLAMLVWMLRPSPARQDHLRQLPEPGPGPVGRFVAGLQGIWPRQPAG